MPMYFKYEYIKEENYIRLSCCKNGQRHIGIDVYPHSGFKTAGMYFMGKWLQPYAPYWNGWLNKDFFGNIILYPTPNRVRNHTFNFEGDTVAMIKNGIPRTQHGIAFDSPWHIKNIAAHKDCVEITAVMEIHRNDDNFQAYPYESFLAMTYTLTESSLCCEYYIKNMGQKKMPFGIGIHPWFLLPGGSEKVSLCMPAKYYYETTEDLLPTGRMVYVDEDLGFDLNTFRDVRTMDLDTVFFTNGSDIKIRYDDRGYQLCIHTTGEFIAGVVFTAFNRGFNKKGYEAFCVESQTCCTDAINMYTKGFQYSGLCILNPAESKKGFVEYKIEDLGRRS